MGGKWHQLDQFLDQFMAPAMLESGFRSRGGRFELESAEHNLVIVAPKGYTPMPLVSFHVDWVAVPRVICDFYLRNGARRRPSLDWGLIRSRMVVPGSVRYSPPEDDCFIFDFATQYESYGNGFHGALIDTAIPLWFRALEREFLAAWPVTKYSSSDWYDSVLRQAILSVDDGDPDQVAAWLDDAERRLPAPHVGEMIDWLRQRLSARQK